MSRLSHCFRGLLPWSSCRLLLVVVYLAAAIRIDDDADTGCGSVPQVARATRGALHSADVQQLHSQGGHQTSRTATVVSPKTPCMWEPVRLQGWCEQGKAQRLCDRLYWCGQERFVISTVMVCMICVLLWLFAAFGIFYFWEAAVNRRWPSKYANEETRSWFVWHSQSMWLSVLVVYMALPATWRLLYATPEAQFSRPKPDVVIDEGLLLNDYVAIGQAGHLFFCYIIVDVITSSLTRTMQMDVFVHHLLFIFFCWLVQYNCFVFYLAGILLLMEVSSIFLNYFTFFRNRFGTECWTVKLSFYLFYLSFIYFRLVALTWVGFRFFWDVARGDMNESEVPRLHLRFISALIVGVMALQFFWAIRIGQKLIQSFGGKSPGKG